MDVADFIGGFFLALFGYLFYPLIRIKINDGKFERKRAKKIALWNSVIVGVIIFILKGVSGALWSFWFAFIFYFINKAILTKVQQPSRPDGKWRQKLGTVTNYKCGKCGKEGPYGKVCPDCGSTLRIYQDKLGDLASQYLGREQ